MLPANIQKSHSPSVEIISHLDFDPSCEHLEVAVDHEIALSNVLGEVYPLHGCMSRKGDPGGLLPV